MAIFHSVPPFTRSSPLHFSFLWSVPLELWGGSHRIPLLSSPCTIFSKKKKKPSFSQLFLQLLQLFTLPRLVLPKLHTFVTRPMLSPFFSLCFTSVSHPLFFFLQNLGSCSPCCRLRDFVQKCCPQFCNHLTHSLLMQFFHVLIFLFHSLQPRKPFLHGYFVWMKQRLFAVCRQQVSNPLRFSASFLPFDQIFFNISFITFIFDAFTFFFFRGVFMHALPSL